MSKQAWDPNYAQKTVQLRNELFDELNEMFLADLTDEIYLLKWMTCNLE